MINVDFLHAFLRDHLVNITFILGTSSNVYHIKDFHQIMLKKKQTETVTDGECFWI